LPSISSSTPAVLSADDAFRALLRLDPRQRYEADHFDLVCTPSSIEREASMIRAAAGDRESGPDISLVLLPGLDGSGVFFGPLLKHLAPRVRPIVVAFPPDEPLGYEELLPHVLAAIPQREPFVLLGESFAGPLALTAAETRPANLMGVVLCASFVRNPVVFRPNWLRHLARPFAFKFFPALSQAKALLNRSCTSEMRGLSAEALSEVRPAVLAHRVRSVLQVDVREKLLSCPVPILYLRGERDHIVPGHNAKEIKAIRPSVQIAQFPCSHWVLQSQPTAAAAAIDEFLRGLENGEHLTSEPRV
jgi:pimeloyl-[acyl-carrier protein] methyl ester esterase